MVANVKVLPNLQYQALHNLLKVFNRVLCKFQNFIEQFFESCVDSGEKKVLGTLATMVIRLKILPRYATLSLPFLLAARDYNGNNSRHSDTDRQHQQGGNHSTEFLP